MGDASDKSLEAPDRALGAVSPSRFARAAGTPNLPDRARVIDSNEERRSHTADVDVGKGRDPN